MDFDNEYQMIWVAIEDAAFLWCREDLFLLAQEMIYRDSADVLEETL